MRTFSTVRASLILGGIVALFAVLCGRVAYLQTYGREQTILRADRQQHQNIILQARRGGIFDRNGILMAGTVQTQTLFIDPKFMAEEFARTGEGQSGITAAINQLAAEIDKTPEQIRKILADRPDSRYVKIADGLDAGVRDGIDQLNIPGVGVVPSSRRVYPMGSIACHVLGGVGGDGAGIEGIELQYDKLLAGKDGFERQTKDARRRPIGVAGEDYFPPQHGQTIVLTINSNIQMMTEQELAATCNAHKAKRGEAIVMDPQTGEVLAMANWSPQYPGFDPSNLNDSPPEARRNRAITDPYEPGSTFKPFIAGPALMWGVTTPGEVWPIHGGHYIAPDGRHVTDIENYFQNLCTWDGLVKSSNILMSMLGERLGNARLHQAITSFRFGSPTGIDLPGENQGKVNPLKKWTNFSTESVSQGYEVMVTPLQLARGFCAIANGGKLVQPHLLLGTLDSDGEVLSKSSPTDFEHLPQVLSPAIAVELRRILCDVVIRGTARGHRSTTWNISGKTGTSHISEGKSGYSPTRFNSSFMCCAPAEDPKLVVVFIIHDPGSAHFGGDVAAPGAVHLMEEALTYMGVPGSPPLPLPPAQIAAKLWDFQASQITDRTFGSKGTAE
jgi:cell division protein FtsI/penicillin-binding protein 2